MKKQQFVFILLLLLPFTGCKSVVKDTVVEPVVQVEKRQTGVLFERKVNGKWGWHEVGDETKDHKYVGEIENGKPHGRGDITFADGDQYVGKFKDGQKHGQGTLTTPDRDRYVGKFWHGKKHGQGTLSTSNGDKYVGRFYHGKKHGQGIYTFGKGEWEGQKYVGEYKDGKMSGQGTYTWSDGRKYVGEWKNDKHWNGILYDKDGKIIGNYVNGEKQ